MIEDYEMKGHKLVMDNYYNSPNLFLALKARGIGGLGTLRHNRVRPFESSIDRPPALRYQEQPFPPHFQRRTSVLCLEG
jgi:hypothetical protein